MDMINYLDSMFEKYQMIFDHSPFGICITEFDGSITMNNTCSTMLGYSQTDLLEVGWKNIIYKDDLQKYHNLFDIYSEDNNGTIIIEIRFVKKDTSVIWAEVTSKIKNDEEGKKVFLVSMIREISDYKILQEKLKLNESRYKELFENNPNPMWLYDIQSLKFLMVNQAAVANYGYSCDEFLSMTIKDIRPKEDIPNLLANLNGIDSTINNSDIWRHKRKDGSIFLVKISSHSIKLNGYIARVILALDVTEKVTAKQNLVIEAAKLKSIIESTSDAIFSVDKNYCYTSFNSAHTRFMNKLCNVNIEIGRSMPAYLPTDQENISSKSFIDRALNGETVNEILVANNDTQSKNYLDIKHNPIKNEHGKIIGVSVFVKDITSQKIAFNKVNQLSQAVEQSPVTIFVTNIDGNIQYVNKKGLEVSGYSINELIGKNPRLLSSGELKKDDYKVLWDTIKSGREWRGEFHNKKKDGGLYWEHATISPIVNESGEIINFLAIKEDITDRKKNEQELIAAKEKAEEINRIKSIFFSNMSHELRTPLVGILGFADILSNSIEDESEKAMASSILQSGKRLLNTLTSLMNLSELESSNAKIELDELDINVLCEDLFNNYIARSSNPNVKFNASFCSDPIVTRINERLFRESISQILNNAVTYTEHGFVQIKTYKKSESLLGSKFGVIEIADTGIGIPSEKMNVVFEEFRQVSEGFGRNYEGTGLGLTLTKKYVEKMGGTIELKSEVGKGTKVFLNFPFNEKYESAFIEEKVKSLSSAVISNILKDSKSAKKDKRILIVEDDEINVAFLEKCFAKVCSFKSVGSGTEAIQSAVEEKFDLLLMDINLKNEMSGITATQAIRKIRGYENVPIVAMTAYTAPEEIEEFLAKGCSHYISKPFIMNELLTLVDEIFEAA